jgi:hypothetical protein
MPSDKWFNCELCAASFAAAHDAAEHIEHAHSDEPDEIYFRLNGLWLSQLSHAPRITAAVS